MKTWNPEMLLRALLVFCFYLQKQSPKIILESNCFKISKNSVENTRGGFLF